MTHSGDAETLAEADNFSSSLDIVYREVDRMIRMETRYERYRDEMIDAGLGRRGLEKAAQGYDPNKGAFETHAKAVVRKAIREYVGKLTKPNTRTVRVGLDDEAIEQVQPADVSLDDVNENGFTGHDLIGRDRREPEQLSPLDELIRAEQANILTDVADPELYEALLAYEDAAHGDGTAVLSAWARRLGFDNPETLRKVLERERQHLKDRLGEDFFP